MLAFSTVNADGCLRAGLRARTALEWLKLAYDTSGQNLREAVHNQPGYYGIKALHAVSPLHL